MSDAVSPESVDESFIRGVLDKSIYAGQTAITSGVEGQALHTGGKCVFLVVGSELEPAEAGSGRVDLCQDGLEALWVCHRDRN